MPGEGLGPKLRPCEVEVYVEVYVEVEGWGALCLEKRTVKGGFCWCPCILRRL